ncbi:MAG: J domain-containing protein, partial [Candidatus Dadabacteria bacterium]
YLNDQKLAANVTPDQLKKLTLGSFLKGNLSVAERALIKLLYNQEYPFKKADSLLLKIGEDSRAYKLFERVLSKVDPKKIHPSLLATMIFYVAKSDVDWVRTNAIAEVYRTKNFLKDLIQREVDQLIRDKNINEAQLSKDKFCRLLGSQDSFCRKLSTLVTRARDIIEISRSRDVENLYPYIEIIKRDKYLHERLSSLLLNILQREAGRFLALKNYQKALAVISRVDPAQRTPTTHKLALQALRGLKPGSSLVLLEESVRKMVIVLSANDQRIKNAVRECLLKEIDLRVASYQLKIAERLLNLFVVISPDPNRENDLLRIKIAEAYTASGREAEADRILAAVKTGVGFKERFLILYKKITGDLYLLLSVLLIPFLFAAWLFVRRYGDLLFGQDYSEIETRRRLGIEGTPENPAGFRGAGRRGLNPMMQEYQSCLNTLGLSQSADLKSIKGAYRNQVKEVHPDLNQDVDEEGRERFLELTRAYERAVELYEELGLGKLEELK